MAEYVVPSALPSFVPSSHVVISTVEARLDDEDIYKAMPNEMLGRRMGPLRRIFLLPPENQHELERDGGSRDEHYPNHSVAEYVFSSALPSFIPSSYVVISTVEAATGR